MSTPLRIVYDDQPDAIIAKVNKALAAHGIALVDDGQEHDGFVLYEVRDSRPPAQWSYDRPTAAGWYWHRQGDDREVVCVTRSESGEWYGNGNPLWEYGGAWWPVPVQEPSS